MLTNIDRDFVGNTMNELMMPLVINSWWIIMVRFAFSIFRIDTELHPLRDHSTYERVNVENFFYTQEER